MPYNAFASQPQKLLDSINKVIERNTHDAAIENEVLKEFKVDDRKHLLHDKKEAFEARLKERLTEEANKTQS